jgi:hypothetical protein
VLKTLWWRSFSLLELLNRSCVRWYPKLALAPYYNEMLYLPECARVRGTLESQFVTDSYTLSTAVPRILPHHML